VVGGLVVSFFAALAGVLKPKSFAGLFGAAPSVGLATLGLTIVSEGKSYAAIEAAPWRSPPWHSSCMPG
jgi:hypothetical protein